MVARAQVEAWIADEVDPAAAAELRELLDAGDDAELEERFAAPLAFGTAGLRGPLRAGPNGMNRAVVRRAAAGIVAWLDAQGRRGAPVVVGFDARYGSTDFARDSAAIFAAAGYAAGLLPRVLPTPVLAFAVQHLGAAAGVMVTASHNPPQDNGYKVYAADGAQIVPPADRDIEAAIEAVGPTRAIALDGSGVRVLGEELVTAYVDAVVSLIGPGPRELRIVHTAMHGVGTETLRAVFAAAGFDDVIPVPQQELPDPDFPTVAFPNPEEPGALDLALALARDRGADLIIANDPDADRCAVAVPARHGRDMAHAARRRGRRAARRLAAAPGRARHLRHDDRVVVDVGRARGQARRRLRRDAHRLQVDLARRPGSRVRLRGGARLRRRAESRPGQGRHQCRTADRRAGGRAQGGRVVACWHDSTSWPRSTGATPPTRSRSASTTSPIIADTMRRIRAQPPATLLGAPVTVEDLLPDADVVRWRWPGGRVVVRPSGTEPKLKAYLEVVEPSGSAEVAAAALVALRDEVSAIVGS